MKLGRGIFLILPPSAPAAGIKVTIVGEVYQGGLDTGLPTFNEPINAGNSYRSSPVPQQVNFDSMNITPQNGDALYLFRNTGASYSVLIHNYNLDDLGGWDAQTEVEVGEGFYYFAATGGSSISRAFKVPTTP